MPRNAATWRFAGHAGYPRVAQLGPRRSAGITLARSPVYRLVPTCFGTRWPSCYAVCVHPRLLALAAALTATVPAAVTWIHQTLPARDWILLTIATTLGLPLILSRRRSWLPAVLAILLGWIGGLIAGRVRMFSELTLGDINAAHPWPGYDLRDGAIPNDVTGFIEVRGYFRNEWVLDEYQVANGQQPNQNEIADAVLVPFTSTLDRVLALEGAIVVARVRNHEHKRSGLQTIRGHVEHLPLEVLDTLVTVRGASTNDGPPGILLDTLELPSRRDVAVSASLLMLAVGLSLACGLLAARMRD